MKKLSICLIVLFCIMLSMALANTIYFQEANAGLRLPGGNGATGHGSNIANPISNSNYTKCTLPSALYNPVSVNFTQTDRNQLILTTSTKKIQIYDFFCTLQQEISYTSKNIIAMPVVRNFNGNAQQEILVLTNSSLDAWEYDTDTNLFENVYGISFGSIAVSAPSTSSGWLSCYTSDDYSGCIGIISNTDDVIVFNLTKVPGQSYTFMTQGLSDNTFQVVSEHNYRSGVAYTEIPGKAPVTPFCFLESAGNDFKCDILNLTGNLTETVYTYRTGGAIEYINQLSSYYARVGSVHYHLLNYVMGATPGNPQGKAFIYDQSGTKKLELGDGTNTVNKTSNWAVADFDKDGLNEACILVNITNLGNHLYCYDGSLNRVYDLALNTSDNPNFTTNIILADFKSENSYLGIGTPEGIFLMNETINTSFYSFSHSGISRTLFINDSSVMTVINRIPGSPALVFIDDTAGFILANNEIITSCGDGVCSEGENSFTCVLDCEAFDLEDQCLSDDNCPTGFPTCLNGWCVAGYNASLTCIDSSNCPLTNPVCFQNYCILGVSGGIAQTGEVNDNEFGESINNAMGMLTGGNKQARHLLGYALLLGAIVLLAIKKLELGVVYLCGVIFSGVLYILTFLPIFVPILLVLVGVVILIISKAVSSPSAG